jgi:hypothetical protein
VIEGRRALDLALDLARMPTLGESMRAHPLPPDTLVVIRIAAGCEETSRQAVRATGLSASVIRDACVFYLEHVLLASDADSHRILGVWPGAPRSEMREHMRWLLKWLHPDGNQNEWESVFAGRVLKAWREAGAKKQTDSPGRNAAGASRNSTAAPRPQPPNRWIAVPLSSATGRGRMRLARWFRSLSPFSRQR